MRLLGIPRYCQRCFTLKVASEDQWVAMTADNDLYLGDYAAATNIWNFWAGKWGMPGRRPFAYLHSKLPGQASSWSLRAYPDGTVKWGDNAWDLATNAPHVAAKDMLFMAAPREATDAPVPSEALIGVCASPSTSENCTYIGASGDRLLLMPADRALAFQWRCVSCDSRPLDGNAAGVIVGLVALALLPLGLYRTWRSRRELPPPAQWPAAPRSSLAWLLFFISWALVVLGLTPAVLWYWGRWWNEGADYPLVLTVLGAAGMQMCLRQDDPLSLIRLISLLNVITRLFLSWFALHEVDLLYDRIFDVDSSAFGDAIENRDYPLSTQFGRFAVDGVHFVGTVVLQLLIVVFCISQQPLWWPGRARRAQPQPLRWLWRTMRYHLFASALVLFLMSLASLCLSFVHRATAYPSEVQQATRLLTLDLSLGSGLLITAVVSSETSRLRIHLRNLIGFRRRYSVSVTREPRPAVTRESPTDMDRIEMTLASEAQSALSNEAILAAAAPPGVAYVPQPMPPPEMWAAGSASLWSDVDVSTWRDPDGRFDGLRLVSRIGQGGYATVLLGELDTPPTLSAGVAVGRVADAGSSTDKPGPSGGFHVAVKVFHRAAYKDTAEVHRLQRELELALSFANPYVVRTLGTTLLSGLGPALILELMAGSLADVLYKSSGSNKNVSHPTREMTGALKRRILLEVALGLEYLHSEHVVHRDIKPANVLLDGEMHAKISDFGIATRFAMETLTADIGTARYMAPEVIFGPYDERADIFAFGVLTWETLHEAVSFGEISPLAAVFNIQRGLRPPFKLPEDLVNLVPLIETCWKERPQERPQGMSAVITILNGCNHASGDAVAGARAPEAYFSSSSSDGLLLQPSLTQIPIAATSRQQYHSELSNSPFASIQTPPTSSEVSPGLIEDECL